MRVTIELQELDSGNLTDCAAEALTERRVQNALNKSREGLKWFLVKSVKAERGCTKKRPVTDLVAGRPCTKRVARSSGQSVSHAEPRSQAEK